MSLGKCIFNGHNLNIFRLYLADDTVAGSKQQEVNTVFNHYLQTNVYRWLTLASYANVRGIL
ncbi:hypothetical protein GCM10017161_36540 [Thalassotalea marina]|uniref:Uncharacterized protein n=1 Tax=Thalassotalea marina TaxID=1673741 RepID=A0A919BQU8_9GAMM|nr:hypothetical protein GCM10017161_36540 [Thalassotalea marina]